MWSLITETMSRAFLSLIILRCGLCLMYFAAPHTVRTEARKLGQAYGAKEITIKHLWEGYKITESRENVVNFSRYDGKYNFYIPLTVKNGERRKFKDFDDSELFA